MRKILIVAAALLLMAGPALPLESELPDEAKLSSDRMRFDSKTGDFLATGNVIITAGDLIIKSPRGAGNIKRREVEFSDGIEASGDWQGEWVDLKAGSILIVFGEQRSYSAAGGVKGDVGKITIDADRINMQGTEITAVNVRRLEDREAGVTFGANDIKGSLVDGVLTNMTARRNVWIKGRPNRSGDMVDIRGDSAVYSVERGSVVLNGNVKAVQKGRTLTSNSLVYFPELNRVEAIGGMTKKNNTVSADRPTIKIDLKQEKRK